MTLESCVLPEVSFEQRQAFPFLRTSAAAPSCVRHCFLLCAPLCQKCLKHGMWAL